MKSFCALLIVSFSTTLFGDVRLSKQNGKLSKLNWKVVNDTVMGGRSSSRWTSNSSEFIFEGNLSLENNGGFASIRCEFKNDDLSVEDGIYLKVKGDGRNYQFDDIKGSKGTLVMFICNHCPYVKSVIGRIVEDCNLIKDKGIGIIAVMSNDVLSLIHI